MQYEGMVYRPPSEAYSLILQVTIGCSHNKCRFCSMYKDKKFHIRQLEDILTDLRECRAYYSRVRRIFLADGDALCLSNAKLLAILNAIRDLFPECERVGIYGRATDILRKTPEELMALKEAGIGIVYVGAESGDPEVLARMCKNATREQLIEGVRRAEDAGIAASVTFISGLGGRERWKEHAVASATMISEMRPSYASWLTLMLDPSAPVTKDIAEGKFELLKPLEVLDEMEVMLEHVELPEGVTCVFRSNHASNYLSLKGDLPADRDNMLAVVRQAKENSDMLRPEYWRAL
ncbi:MAG: radical SAM protein [Firmicutes bacterium]|nr:radical SAM protein [Bacillota bacterium]